MTTIHHFSPETGEYLGSGDADRNPLEPGKFLIPRAATTVEPPEIPEGKQAVFSRGEWSLRDIPEVPAPAGRTVEERREVASLERGVFCSRLRRMGILPNAEAVQAARGDWPDTFASFTAGMTDDEASEVQIEWAAATRIRYTAPTLAALALAYAEGDEALATATLDEIFGVTEP